MAHVEIKPWKMKIDDRDVMIEEGRTTLLGNTTKLNQAPRSLT
jgi:hypothetical protein